MYAGGAPRVARVGCMEHFHEQRQVLSLHCITCHIFAIGMSSSHLYIGSVMTDDGESLKLVTMLHHGAAASSPDQLRRDFVRGGGESTLEECPPGN